MPEALPKPPEADENRLPCPTREEALPAGKPLLSLVKPEMAKEIEDLMAKLEKAENFPQAWNAMQPYVDHGILSVAKKNNRNIYSPTEKDPALAKALIDAYIPTFKRLREAEKAEEGAKKPKKPEAKVREIRKKTKVVIAANPLSITMGGKTYANPAEFMNANNVLAKQDPAKAQAAQTEYDKLFSGRLKALQDELKAMEIGVTKADKFRRSSDSVDPRPGLLDMIDEKKLVDRGILEPIKTIENNRTKTTFRAKIKLAGPLAVAVNKRINELEERRKKKDAEKAVRAEAGKKPEPAKPQEAKLDKKPNADKVSTDENLDKKIANLEHLIEKNPELKIIKTTLEGWREYRPDMIHHDLTQEMMAEQLKKTFDQKDENDIPIDLLDLVYDYKADEAAIRSLATALHEWVDDIEKRKNTRASMPTPGKPTDKSKVEKAEPAKPAEAPKAEAEEKKADAKPQVESKPEAGKPVEKPAEISNLQRLEKRIRSNPEKYGIIERLMKAYDPDKEIIEIGPGVTLPIEAFEEALHQAYDLGPRERIPRNLEDLDRMDIVPESLGSVARDLNDFVLSELHKKDKKE